MTNRDMFELNQALELVSDMQGSKFASAVAKNKAKVRSIINSLRKVKRHPKEEEFERRRVEICEKHCERDGDGNPVLEHNAFQGLQGNADFDAEIDDLREEFKALMDHRQKEKDDFNVSLDEEVEVEIHKVAFKDVPESITADQLGRIMPMVIEPSDSALFTV